MTLLNTISKNGKQIVCNHISVKSESLCFNKHPSEYIFYALPEETTSLFYGIELEASSLNKYTTDSYAPTKIPFLKSDFIFTSYEGSVSPIVGLEFKNHPATFKFLKKNKIQWHRILRQKTLKVNNTCGMHIHLSAAAFGDKTLFNFIKFIYSNKDFVFSLSERTEDKFNMWCRIGEGLNGKDCQKKFERIKEFPYESNKETAITSNMYGKTIEVRIFAATLNPIHFWKNLEFCDCVYHFCKYINSSEDTTVTNFINYLVNNKCKYRNLYNFLVLSNFLVKDMIPTCV